MVVGMMVAGFLVFMAASAWYVGWVLALDEEAKRFKKIKR